MSHSFRDLAVYVSDGLISSSPPSMSEIITQTVAKTDGDDNDCIISLELLGDSCANNAQIPFNPESHGLSADFQLTKFSDPRRKSLQLERQERQSLLNLFHGKVIFSMQNRIGRKDFYKQNNYRQSYFI